MSRLLSFTEIDTALTCFARWDFAYGGRLAGSTLQPKATAPVLSEGRAWGAGVAAWHRHAGTLLGSFEAHAAIKASLEADGKKMAESGFQPSVEESLAAEQRLGAMLDHYASTVQPLPNLTRLEEEIVVPVPSRSGLRGSSRYRFLCYLDGFTDNDGQRWLVEFKLRRQLTPVRVIQLSRQIRWYAWAMRQQGGPEPFGVIVEERLNEVPKPPRVLKNGMPSHAKDQMTSPELYVDLCAEKGVGADLGTLDALRGRSWSLRTPLVFDQDELDQAGLELTSAAKLIRDLDSGEIAPIRHAGKMTCGGCRYRDICDQPQDELFVDTQFDRGTPKRFRTDEELMNRG